MLLALSACSVVPDPIQVTDENVLVPFDTVMNDPQASNVAGQSARWGGRIVGVENKKEVSEIEVVFFPDSSTGKPRIGQESTGRFKAVVEGFVDPLVFVQGRLITVVGEVTAPLTGIIGEQEYTYPTLNAQGYYMWKQTTEVDVDQIGFVPFHARGFRGNVFYGNPYLISPFYRNAWSPWFDPWGPGFRSRVRVTHNVGHSQGATVKPSSSRTSPAVRPNISEPAGGRTSPVISDRKISNQ
jgi:outer membrane lipoprotein